MIRHSSADRYTNERSTWRPVLLIGIFVSTAAISALSKSATYDERTNLGIGEHLLRTREWATRFSWHHPPLSFYLSALPEALPERVTDCLTHLSRARLAMLTSAAGLAALVYLWACELYGRGAAVVALVLTSFSPNLLAHMPLVTPDGTLTCTVFATAYAVWRYGRKPSFPRAAAVGAALGLSLLSKFTAALFLPVWGLAGVVVWMRVRRLRVVEHLFLAGLLSLLILNAGYAFRGFGQCAEPSALTSERFGRIADTRIGSAVSCLFAEPFLRGLDFQMAHAAEGEWGYLMGEHSKEGWPYYFAAAFLIKTPVALQLLLVAAAGLALCRAGTGRGGRTMTGLCLVLPPVLLFGYLSLVNTINIGLRYVLPVLPFVHVLIARLAVKPSARLAALLCSAILVYVAESAAVFPHYLAFFNAWIGGPANGHRYLIDSNLDWGQDAMAALRYRDARSGEAALSPGDRFVPGEVVVSANALYGTSPEEAQTYAWLRQFEPVGHIGYSYLIFDVPMAAVPKSRSGTLGLVHRANLLLAEGRVARAAKVFRRAIRNGPHEPRAYFGLAKCYEVTLEIAKAKGILLEGLSRVPPGAKGRAVLEERLRSYRDSEGETR